MDLAFSTNAYTRVTLGEALRGIKRAGFPAVEILADSPHAYPGNLNPRFADGVREDLEKLSLKVSNVNCNCSFGYWKDAPAEPYFEPSLISPNPAHRADRIRLILAAMDFAERIGARNLSITSGRMLAGMPPAKAAAQLSESLRPVLDRAEERGIDVGIECEPGLFLEYVDELLDWISRMGSPRLGANLDVGHCQVIGESIPDAVRKLKGRIWNLHVEDIPARKHYHLVPGDGTLDWQGLRQALRDVSYDRYATVELYTMTAEPQRAAERSWAYLSKWLRPGPAAG